MTAVDLIKQFEGKRLKAYLCPAGRPTIGYGHTGKDVRLGMTITDAEAERLLAEDIEKVRQQVLKLVTVPLSQNKLDALISFVYNVGVGAFTKSRLRNKINASARPEEIEREWFRWVYANSRMLPGLVTRRRAEYELWSKE